jgi:hypothetical protein
VRSQPAGASGPAAELNLVTDASSSAVGALLQQKVVAVWQPLAFLSRKLDNAQLRSDSCESKAAIAGVGAGSSAVVVDFVEMAAARKAALRWWRRRTRR